MKSFIKETIKRIVPETIMTIGRGYLVIKRHNPKLSLVETIIKGKVVLPNVRLDYKDDYTRQFSIITKRCDINSGAFYVYPFDTKILRLFPRKLICSVTVDFGKVLKTDLKQLHSQIKDSTDESFMLRELGVITSIESLAEKIAKRLKKEKVQRAKTLSGYFPEMLYRAPKSFDEALQKILFYDALFWQMGHLHIGLGRLDMILYEYYERDITNKKLSAGEAKEMLREFLKTLGKDTIAKSAGLKGDTGQYILLGGIDKDGQQTDNALTQYFIELMTELKVPDPKLILRVNKNTTDKIWQSSINCLVTGIGSPLIMDEAPIMRKMVEFGYSPSDVWNVGTSACWEPLIIGKSFDQNNPFRSAVALAPLNKLLRNGCNYNKFEDLYIAYKELYKEELESVVLDINFDCSPLFTLFFDKCIERALDFTDGGAVYAYHGAQVVSLPNTINSLLNIKRLVYEDKTISLSDCRKAIETNFAGMEDLCVLLQNTGKKFGSTDKEVVKITNDLIEFTSTIVKHLKSNGNKVKVGFSSPNYIGESKNFQASLDGRKNGDPFAVHISPISSRIDISEILDFSTQLVYGDNCINGNVVDFILPSSYIRNKDKLIGILKNACSKEVFEIQLNVMDKAMLIDAKAHPEKYPNLVVRVWGFSAYFNDLPEEYKDNLIHRAEIYEAA